MWFLRQTRNHGRRSEKGSNKVIEVVFWAITVLLLIFATYLQNCIINDQYKDIEILEAKAQRLEMINRIQRITLKAYKGESEDKKDEKNVTDSHK